MSELKDRNSQKIFGEISTEEHEGRIGKTQNHDYTHCKIKIALREYKKYLKRVLFFLGSKSTVKSRIMATTLFC